MQTGYDRHYFNLKGKKAEEILHLLAEKTFLTDWCYRNPKLSKGKELCDLLVVFDDIAIIWQIKDLKIHKDGKYKEAKVGKNLRQLSGARKKLFESTVPIELINPRRGKEIFDPKPIKEVYLISALMGESKAPFAFIEKFKNLTINVFDRQFTEIVLNELDTIRDFLDYLRAKELLVNTDKEIIIVGGEEELLAFYLLNERSFDRFQNTSLVTINEGSWKHLQSKSDYQTKKKVDEVSYLWDGIISRAHEALLPEYEKIARELARHNRFERRIYSQAFIDAFIKADQDKKRDMFRRVVIGENVTYCFLFMDDPEPRENRKAMLFTMCFVARGKYSENTKVIGIATEKKLEPLCSYDFCLLDKPSWTKRDQKQMEEIQKHTKISVNPTMSTVRAEEYPQR